MGYKIPNHQLRKFGFKFGTGYQKMYFLDLTVQSYVTKYLLI